MQPEEENMITMVSKKNDGATLCGKDSGPRLKPAGTHQLQLSNQGTNRSSATKITHEKRNAEYDIQNE